MANVQSQPTVLLVTYINSQVPELLRVGRLLLHSGQYRPLLIFHTEYETIHQRYIEICHEERVPLITPDGRPYSLASTNTVSTRRGLGARLSDLGKSQSTWSWLGRGVSLLYGWWKNISVHNRLRRQLVCAEDLMTTEGVAGVILTEENPSYHTAVYTHCADQLGIPVIVVPYTMANATEAAEHAIDQPARHVNSWIDRWFARRYPHWQLTYRDRRLFPLPLLDMLAQEQLGIAPKHPWTLSDGRSTIAVESQAMARYYSTNNIRPDRLVITGTLSDDVLYAVCQEIVQRRRTLDRELQLVDGKPIVLCALPPPWFPRPGCDFSSHQELVEYWLRTLTKQDQYQVVVNLHPSLSVAAMRPITDRYAVKLSTRDVTELIPLSELYVASISATIRWAIACGVPVLNYDVYKYRFNDYDTVSGVVTIEEQQQFADVYRRFTSDSSYRAALARNQLLIMNQWGNLDGQSGQRLINLLTHLIQSAQHQR